MDVVTVLAARRDFITSQRLLSEDALNWPIFCANYLHYTATRAAFLERRRHERTDAALAEAQAEVARLRAALDNVAAIAAEGTYYATGTTAGLSFDTILKIANRALETAPAGEATNGNG